MAKRINLSISIPPAMAQEVARACELEHRTRSELIREALRFYLRSNETVHQRGQMVRKGYVIFEALEENPHDPEKPSCL